MPPDRCSHEFPRPIDDRYFEDYVTGDVHEFGAVTVGEAEIMEFGRAFDPQSFHVDPERARHSAFGGLIASGWHTAALMMRVIVDHYLSSVASLGSPGVDEVRWLRPVRPGDVLSVRVTVVDARRSHSKPDRGVVRSSIEVLNQDRAVVMTVKALNMLRCRGVEPLR